MLVLGLLLPCLDSFLNLLPIGQVPSRPGEVLKTYYGRFFGPYETFIVRLRIRVFDLLLIKFLVQLTACLRCMAHSMNVHENVL